MVIFPSVCPKHVIDASESSVSTSSVVPDGTERIHKLDALIFAFEVVILLSFHALADSVAFILIGVKKTLHILQCII